MAKFVLYFSVFLFGAIGLSSANECFKQASDIVFAVDSSHSIRSHDFKRQLSFLRAVIDRFTVGQNQIQVGVISFSTSVTPDIKLNDFDNTRDLKIAIGNIQHLGQGTRTDKVIAYVRDQMYLPKNGGRPWAKRQLVLITDGLSKNTSATLIEASAAKSEGIEIFSIGIGEGIEQLEILGMASDPKDQHVFNVEDYNQLMGMENTISKAACHQSVNGQNQNSIGDWDGQTGDPARACEANAADVIFLMDSSSSIWKVDFDRQIKFIQKVTASFDIGEAATRVGVIAYSDGPVILVSLTDKQTHSHIHKSLADAPYITGGTGTALAIHHARRKELAGHIARRNVARMIIILSDGQSDNINDTLAEAAKAQAEGIQIFAVGIGEKTKATELMAMASDPDDKFVFHVDDFQSLADIKDLLPIKTCEVAASLTQKDKAEKCPTIPTDAVFIYDRKALSRHHHNFVISVINEVTESRRLNSDDLRVGVVRKAQREASPDLNDIELTNDWTQSKFKSKLDPDSRTASIELLFRKVRHQYFSATFSFLRLTHKRTVVLFLDSALENKFAAEIEADRLKRAHVRIIVVALGNHYKKREILNLASEPHDEHILDVHKVDHYHVRDVVSSLLSILCD